MSPRIDEIWVYLSASPLLGLTLTLLAYQGAVWINQRCKEHPLANPVLLAVIALVALLTLTGTPYPTYFDGAQFVHFLLGPATVALAIPLYTQFRRVRALLLPVLAGLVSEFSTLKAQAAAGNSGAVLESVLPKIADTLAALPEEDVNAVIHPCLGVVMRQHEKGWVKIFDQGALMFDDIDLFTMLQLVARVVADSLGNFLKELPGSGTPTQP